MSDGHVLMERDGEAGIARLTLDNPGRRNAYDPAMRERLGAYLDELALDDAVKVVVLRGAGGVFTTGADMANAYSWYGIGAGDGPAGADGADGARAAETGPESTAGTDRTDRRRRPSQRRRLAVDRRTFGFYHEFLGYSKVTVAEVRGFALGGGFELALMADISVVAGDALVGMPATRLLGPALGSLHMFFYRLGPTLARRLLLTGDAIAAEELAHLSIFTEVVDDAAVAGRVDWWARKVARMPADGLVIAKEAFRLVEQLQGYQGEEVASYLFHAYGTNLQFEDDEFNFVRARAQHGTTRALQLRDTHFDIPEP